ncbi:PAS domain-containing protein [Sulfuricurvum sp.]|uniref:PAS domain-containing protein n=1 Tax=Sulfuricurvum sp. TaxID=2025608 RepID=UPI003BB786E7
MSQQEVFFGENEFIVSKTDLGGRVTYGNALFIKISGYEENELIGAPHNILRHPDMPALVFKLLWETVKTGEEIFAYALNQNKEGNYYWVFAHVTPSINGDGKIIGYHSVRRKPTEKALKVIKPLYAELLRAEKAGGISASQKIFDTLLQQKGVSYEELVFSL